MATVFQFRVLLFLIILLLSVQHSEQLQSSQAHTLYRIQLLLHYPAALRSWNVNKDFCDTEWDSPVTVVCYEESVTQLHISGSDNAPPLPKNFSMESFVTTLEKLPSLKVLTLASLGLWGPLPGKIARLSSLEILNVSSNYLYGIIPQEVSMLTNLQTLILDNNMFYGPVPEWIDSLINLAVLSFRNNSFSGSLPNSLGSVENLRVLSLSTNNFSGLVPNLSKLKNLQVLDLGHNALGTEFPQLGSELVILILRSNKFRSGIPPALSTLHQLQLLDLSSNTFVGPFPPWLLTLPSLTSLNVSANKLTGMLTDNLSCNNELHFVNLSSNLLTGSLPKCLRTDSRPNLTVLCSYNCLSTGDRDQHAPSFCHNEALAVGVFPHQNRRRPAPKAVVIASTIGGVLGGVAILVFLLLILKREHARRRNSAPPTRLIAENASTGYTSKFLSDARYISQTMKLGSLGLPPYRTFSLEEIEEATSNFNTSAFMGEGSHGQMYRGQLKNGSTVVIRCLKMKKRHSTQSFTHHVEMISRLRHRHIVSALGHCFECYLDDASVSRIFLVFEYVPNGNLRSWISEECSGKKLMWEQRIAVVIGVAKGVQFLHTGIVPGVLANDLKIAHILLDQNLIAKIGSYNFPLLPENMGKASNGASSSGSKESNFTERAMYKDKIDIYDFGIILLEIITGRPFDSRNEVEAAKQLLLASILTDNAARKSMADPTIHNSCSDESLKTMMDICSRCLLSNPSDRPSIEDVLWNLQFAAQVQDAWRGGDSDGSPSSPSHSISQRM
uniref:Protein kinase domain-containing protein n=1 Tax=Kalanchoe fedtschenkoi TaxID=63787 RepID=A0A7N0SWX6_KALFE